jgi:glucosamine-6-phosphate deaminase
MVKTIITDNQQRLGEASGQLAAEIIRQAIAEQDAARIILATGKSQLYTLECLTRESIDWSKVVMFHLDEYIGLPESSPASFRRYLKERFIEKVSGLKEVHLINGEGSPEKECGKLSEIIEKNAIDIALVGIGENGHLAFNDPPADFETTRPFIIVNLDEKCRQQQFGEGWFGNFNDVPKKAITMSIRQIMKSRRIICSVPEARKAEAVKSCFDGPISNVYPASILRRHPDCVCFLDKESSALLGKKK